MNKNNFTEDERNRVFVLGLMYGYAKREDWDAVDDILEAIDPEIWLATEQWGNIHQVEVYLYDNNIDVFDAEF